MKKIEKICDISFILLGVFVFATIVLFPSVGRKIVYYALPSFLMLKFLVFKNPYKEVRSLIVLPSVKAYSLLLLNVSLFSFLPMIMDNVYGDLDCNLKVYWPTASNGVYYVILFLFSICFINILRRTFREDFVVKIFGKELLYFSNSIVVAPFALVTSFIIEFFYYLIKGFSDSNLDVFVRWEGGSSNANIWAVQGSIALLTLVAYYSIFKSGFLRFLTLKIDLKWFIYFYLLVIFASTILAGSVTNILGIFIASVPIVWGISASYVLFIALFALLLSVFLIFFLDGKLVKAGELDFPFNIVAAKKFLPRMRLWSHLMDKLNSGDFNLWTGLGFCEYIEWTKSLIKRGVDHLHNIYYHNFFLYGLPGLYAAFAYLANIWKHNKYSCAVVIYILVASCTDASLINSGPQLQFWLTLPIILEREERTN